MRKILYLAFTAGLLVSCKTNQLYLNVIEPAPVTLSKSVKTPGVINRSMPTDETKGSMLSKRSFLLRELIWIRMAPSSVFWDWLMSCSITTGLMQ
ncbi:MAG TPA: hypothetical protein PLL94_07525 [Bacteroidales bacterium]|nr:hypothetical protein [Bacteroidales bacterium]HQK67981.1 hypothetical protein [Bacteroidales bacterium]